ncbi:MAG: WG repeat-containing protein [Cyclobacteriaceae bacterium]|nr:WG repeat-containing protein [Cyclobacteriaceae bacterium]
MLSFGTLFNPPSAERRAFNNMQKGKWEKARVGLAKAIRKDTLNATAHYVFSTYYFSPGNPAYQIDSAYHYVMKSLHLFERSNAKQRDRMKRFPLDSAILISRREAIDSAAFERAKRINTEQAYEDFLNNFPFATQLDRASELRDEVAYIDALKVNTYASFLAYLNKYPNASRSAEARERYEKLLFEAKTKDRKLASFQSFLEEYSESPYRDEAEYQVLEILTAAGSTASFMDFLKKYPSSRHRTKAQNVLIYLLREKEEPIPSRYLNDSLRHVIKLEQDYLVPFAKDGRYGFMNSEGKEVIKPFTEELEQEYRCGNITEELLVGSNQIIARNGAIIFSGDVQEIEDLGTGYLLVTSKKCSAILHKSGFTLEACVQDARVIADAFIAVKKENRWSLTTLLGRKLPVGDYEDINEFDDVVAFKQSGRYKLATRESVARAADQGTPVFTRLFDEVKRWDGNMLWVRTGQTQGLLDMNLKERIASGTKVITTAFFGAVSTTTEGQRLWSASTSETENFNRVLVQKPWVVVQQEGKWKLVDDKLKVFTKNNYDSVYFVGAVCMALRGDSLHAYVNHYRFIPFLRSARLQFLPGKDSLFYLVQDEGDKKTVFNSRGERLFNVNTDRLEFAGENLFLSIRRERRSLLNILGRPVTSSEYDAMGNIVQGTVAVLKDKKFGFLDVINKKEIKPQYERNLQLYNKHNLIAFKGKSAGLIDWSNKVVLPFEYDEIQFWNDSTALVRKSYQWIIYNFIDKRIIADKIKTFRWLLDTPEEKILIIQQENYYGVISSTKGFILPSTYSDIVNLGSSTKPLYFTEKHVEEASIYVVIYYDHKGNLLRRQVFEIDDYEQIYCSKN